MKLNTHHLLLLLLWIIIGASLRFLNLGEKTPSTIELATLIFSAGNSVLTVPLNQAIALDTLLEPLKYHGTTGIEDVMAHLMQESTHPPLYFLLTHLWLHLFPDNQGLISLWAGRSLSTFFGIVSIPFLFALGNLAFRSPWLGQVAASLMAVSPYGIYLAQEARHYTLAILFIILSLTCLIVAIRGIRAHLPLQMGLRLIWIAVNGLGIATHYFFAFTLCLEGLVLAGFWWQDLQKKQLKLQTWGGIYWVALGTLITGLIWLPSLQSIPNDSLTEWVHHRLEWSEIVAPMGRLLAWIITMLFILPVEGQPLGIIIVSGLILLLVLIVTIPAIIAGIRGLLANSSTRLPTQVFAGIVLGAISLFFIFAYGLETDLTKAARYNFVYFPAFLLLMGGALGNFAQESANLGKIPSFLQGKGKMVIALVLTMGLFGALTVVSNQGYQKSKRADLLAKSIHNISQVPVFIAMEHQTHSETRALIGLGLEWHNLKDLDSKSPQFFLAHKDENEPQSSTNVLYKTLEQIPRPFDLWTLDFNLTIDPQTKHCSRDTNNTPKINGYKVRLYHC